MRGGKGEFSPGFEQLWSMSSRPEILFQPIVDTAGYRILAHFCEADGLVDAAIRAAAAQSTGGLYFIKTCSLKPRCNVIRQAVRESALRPANIVFEFPAVAVVREPSHWFGVYDSYRNAGFGLALTGVGAIPKALRMLRDLRPDYIKLDKSLVRNIERLSCAMTIRGLADLAEEWRGRIVADGVERLLSVEDLWLLNVYLMQGPLLGRPAPDLAQDNSTALASLAQALAVGGATAGAVRAAGAGGMYR